MNTFDTIKLKAGIECLNSYNQNSFDDVVTVRNEETTMRAVLKNEAKTIGLKNITFDFNSDSMIMELSGKILKQNYKDLISIETIEKVIKEINNNGSINLNLNKFMESEVLRVDVTKDVLLEGNLPEYLKFFRFVENGRYRSELYNGSIVYRNNVKTKKNKDRLIMYDKQREMKLVKNKELWNYIKPKDFKNYLRIENNIISFAGMRKKLFIPDNKLESVLTSKRNVLAETFDKIVGSVNENYLSFIYETIFEQREKKVELKDLEKRLGREQIIVIFDLDFDKVKSFLKYMVKGNVSRYVREYKEVLDDMLIYHDSEYPQLLKKYYYERYNNNRKGKNKAVKFVEEIKQKLIA